MELYAGLLVVVGLLVLLGIGVPIYAAVGSVSVITIILVLGPTQAIAGLSVFVFSKISNYGFVPLPLFFLLAQVVHHSGFGGDIYDIANKWVGQLRGGLAMASIAGCGAFGAVCGSTSAAVASIGTFAVPAMLKQNYDKRLVTGSVTAAGGLATLIPPSGLFILYCIISEVSIGKMFMAGVIPGVLLAILMMGSVWVRVKLNPTLAPLVGGVPWRERLGVLPKVLPMLVLVFLVLVTIYLGVCTVTEAAGMGAFGAIVIAIILRRFTFSAFLKSIVGAAQISSFSLLIILAALIFGFVMSLLGITQSLTAFVASLPVSKYVILVAFMVMYLLLGCILENGSIILITTPLVFPIITSLGFDPLWWGVMLVINMDIAGLTPPVGINLFIMKGICPPDISLADIIRGVVPFIIVDLLFLVIMAVFPNLALWLPAQMKPALVR